MTRFSPAAQAVMDALKDEWVAKPDEMSFSAIFAGLGAAALRAAVDQVVPPALEEVFHDRNQVQPLAAMVKIRQELFAIAAELEGFN